MFLKSLKLGIALLLIAASTTGCSEPTISPSSTLDEKPLAGKPSIKERVENSTLDLSKVSIQGRFAYIPIGLVGGTEEDINSNEPYVINLCLRLLDSFEKQYGRVSSYQLDKLPDGYGVSAEVYGLWVVFEPKGNTSPY